MRKVKHIVIHSTGTNASITVQTIKEDWQGKPPLHYLIARDGEAIPLVSIKKPTTKDGKNDECVHIAYVGGIDKDGKPANTLTQSQKDGLFDMLILLSERFPQADIIGQEEGQTQVGFDVKQWLASYVPFIPDYNSEVYDIAA